MDNNIKAAIKWLSESDIIHRDKNRLSFGGINNGYDWINKKYYFVYSEITGYAINSFINLYKWLGEEKYLRLAKNAADYLVKLQVKDKNSFEYGSISHSLTLPECKNVQNYWSFDNAIVLHGIVNLAKIIDEKKYNDICLNIGGWLLKMQKQNGSFYSYYDAKKKQIDHAWNKFEYDDGCLHIKNAIGLMTLSSITNKKEYYDAGLKICNWGESLLDSDYVFWVNPKKKYAFTHAHCYATEGYLYAYYLSSDLRYLNIAKQAGEALMRLQNGDGSLYRIYKNRLSLKRWINEKLYPWKTVDATAQAVRIWTLLYSIDKEEKYLQSAKKGIDFIIKMQSLDADDPNMVGGLYYQCGSYLGKNQLSKVMHTWCTQFSLSAFMLYKSTLNNAKFDNLIQSLY
jgi:uncharacterized protein YyaL (SSP411 family)